MSLESKSRQNFYALHVEMERGSEEAVEYALFEAGAIGTEQRDGSEELSLSIAYFDHMPSIERVRSELLEAFNIYGLPSSTVREMNFSEVQNRDWLAEWKKGWQPLEVGRRFLIVPPWFSVPDDPYRLSVVIEPGMAFGTGTHETTRLCLREIERHFRGGSFLDVGTGTGILAIAAAKLHPESQIIAIDTDELAIEIARENAKVNGVERIEFHTGTLSDTEFSADFVAANLTADTILGMLPLLLNATCGRLVLSGILNTQQTMLTERLNQEGIFNIEINSDGEWVSMTI
jgi:ribosomal protein L11 methyltransferase